MNKDFYPYTESPEIFRPSPFHLEADWIIKTENKNRNCTHAEIDILNAKGILNIIDFKIMELLASYKAVNTYNINYALNNVLPDGYRRDSYERNLRKLVKAGIVLKHALYQHTDEASCGSVQSPLRFYSLSAGSCSYITPLISHPHRFTGLLSDYRLMEQLALSQLLLHFLINYSANIRHYRTNITKAIGSHRLHIDCFLRYQKSDGPSCPISIFLFCCRTHPDSRKDCLTRLCLFFRWLSVHQSEHTNYFILIVVECTQDIFFLQRSIMTCNVPKYYPLYYTTDTDQVSGLLFDHIYQCIPNEETSQLQLIHMCLTL